MKDRAERVIADCLRIAGMTEEPGRTTRRFLTAPMRDVHALLRVRMKALGMTVHMDAAGNLRGRWQPEGGHGKRLVMGSHIDTVPDAGAFDGVLGVVMALAWVELAQEAGLKLPIEVIAFSEEEGVRFGVPFLGSRAVAGSFEPALLQIKDASGETVEEAIRKFGLDPARLGEAALRDEALGFVEIHIEQGPVLEGEDLHVAAVTAIVGQSRRTLEFTGQANHAGTTPMHLRRDALAGAAEWIGSVEALANRCDGLVATVGRVEVTPNAGNVVAGAARVSLDVRHGEDAVRLAALEELLWQAQAVAGRRNLALAVQRLMDEPAAPMDERLAGMLAESIVAAGFAGKRMPSGAGHDAMVMAARMPAAMLFLRSPGGVSHHPSESVRKEDVEAALQVGREFLARLDGQSRF